MDQFEYAVSEYNLNDYKKEVPRYVKELQAAGQEGWELVAVVPLSTNAMLAGVTTKVLATFKRRLPSQAPTRP